jgi:hypothetical protein
MIILTIIEMTDNEFIHPVIYILLVVISQS